MFIQAINKKLSTFQMIIAGFPGVILVGTLLLMLPISVKGGDSASIEVALFTSTSAVCVTGLAVRDTASFWSGFGQTVILILIQIGGLVKMNYFIFKVSLLTEAVGNPGIVIPICLLIIIGGIGFLTWDDIAVHKIHVHKYRMQSKVVLVTTGILIIVPALYLFICEFAGGLVRDRILLSLFQAVTPRTAGFNTASLTDLSGTGRVLMIALMLIGGSPGSTAGGMKTTTFAVMSANASSVFRRKKSVQLFETASAIGTVGLSLGITPDLSFHSHIILVLLMFFGRVGGLTLIYAAINVFNTDVSQRPIEKINVG